MEGGSIHKAFKKEDNYEKQLMTFNFLYHGTTHLLQSCRANAHMVNVSMSFSFFALTF